MTAPLSKVDDAAALKADILDKVRDYWRIAHRPKPFVPGESRIGYAGRVYDDREMVNLVDSSLDFWLTSGPYAAEFEHKMKKKFGARRFLLVNSGSSANLLMLATLCARPLDERLKGKGPGRMVPGDEVITPAVTFPTTLTPIVQHGLVPVFVDCEVGTYNIDPKQIEAAVGPRTRAIFVPHTVGNPCDMETIMAVAAKHDLWVLEDGCDALGGTYDGKPLGTFGQMSSLSFYPAHHITMGEGGGVVVNDHRLVRTATSIRDWGRDCWCDPGKNDTCGKRFGWQLGDLPAGYDHKYVYTNLGYNLKVSDMQAAVGCAQFDKIEQFVAARRRNFRRYIDGLKRFQDVLTLPIVDARAEISPFGFPITVADGVDRNALTSHLELANIETRLVFGGNILKQPGFQHIERRVFGELTQTDRIMRDTFFIGVYPGLSDDMVDYVIDQIAGFFGRKA
ncbi:MAG: lipopolysaccharide biosynthesis protein RfbH [Alphaproteobacteria bacterium]